MDPDSPIDPDRLISDYLDDALTPEEIATLLQWIGAHPDNARLFARASLLHRSLEHRLSAKRLLEQSAALDHSSTDRQPRARSGPARAASFFTLRRSLGIAAALLLIIGLLTFMIWPRTAPAQFLAGENAVWAPGTAAPKIGDHLQRGEWLLDSGIIQLGFDNGNRVVIQGPARFAIADPLHITLHQGWLTAMVTPGGRGFQVSTPIAQVTDLGTEFGVQVSAASTRIAVFKGKVLVASPAGSNSRELSAGEALEASSAGLHPAPFDAPAFTRLLPADGRPLDLIDLLAGGDGSGSASGIGIDAATGSARETKAVTVRHGDQDYIPINDNPVLDGCFIPGGRMHVDSAGHTYSFPATSLFSYGLIWAGPDIPWEGTLPIATTFPADAGAPPTSRVLVMHSNNGFTLNLDAIRTLHGRAMITGFRARVGNSYRPATPDAAPADPLASIHVLVDGVARFEKLSFPSTTAPFDVQVPLSDNDHFLTLATTDGGDGNACDWILWTRPEFMVEYLGQSQPVPSTSP